MINNVALKFDEFREGKQTRLELGKAWLVLATGPDTLGIIEKVRSSAPQHKIWNRNIFIIRDGWCLKTNCAKVLV